MPFRLPSNNIFCAYSTVTAPQLRCEIVSRLRPLPSKPLACEGVWGRAVVMGTTSRARAICISDTVQDPRARVLRYGQTFLRGGFVCDSRAKRATRASAGGRQRVGAERRGNAWHIDAAAERRSCRSCRSTPP